MIAFAYLILQSILHMNSYLFFAMLCYERNFHNTFMEKLLLSINAIPSSVTLCIAIAHIYMIIFFSLWIRNVKRSFES